MIFAECIVNKLLILKGLINNPIIVAYDDAFQYNSASRTSRMNYKFWRNSNNELC